MSVYIRDSTGIHGPFEVFSLRERITSGQIPRDAQWITYSGQDSRELEESAQWRPLKELLEAKNSAAQKPSRPLGLAESILTTTTMSFEGYRITEYKGLVRGIVVRSPTLGQGFLGGLKQLVGGQIGAYAEMCEQARAQAFELLLQHAQELRADAVVGIRYESSEVGGQGSSATEVLCYGTAVKLQRA